MSIHRFPGDFRIGLMNEPRDGVLDPRPDRVEPKVMLFVLLSGHQRFRLGGQRFELDARRLPDAALFRIGVPTEVSFEHNVGRPLTKLSLAMPPNWLSQVEGGSQGALGDLPQDFGAVHFLPSAEIVETARALIGETAALRRMARGMALLDQVIAGLSGRSADALSLIGPGGETAALARLRREISGTAGQKLTAPDLARRCGIGLRSLERIAVAQEGKSLGALIRDERFELALRGLRAGATVAQAAGLAGYGSAANFATAMRRKLGVAPSSMSPTGAQTARAPG